MTTPAAPQPESGQPRSASDEASRAHGHAPDCDHHHPVGQAHDHRHAPHHHDHAGHCPHGSLGEHHPRTDAICIDRVSYTYPAAPGRKDAPQPALRDVTLHVEQGCSLGIIGPNGAGKSTLLKILLGMIEGYRGSVSIMGLSPRQACRRGDVIGFVPQRHQAEWKFPLTAGQVVRLGLTGRTGLFRWYRQPDRQYALQLMEQLGVAPLHDRPIGDLSGGQQQRIFIARALVARPRILIFDEPTVGIDQAGQQQLAQLLHQLQESLGLTMIIVSHDIRAIAAGCNRVACLRGSIHYHDAPQGLTRQVLAEVFQHDLEEVAGSSG